jgi:hypothetical protein
VLRSARSQKCFDIGDKTFDMLGFVTEIIGYYPYYFMMCQGILSTHSTILSIQISSSPYHANPDVLDEEL